MRIGSIRIGRPLGAVALGILLSTGMARAAVGDHVVVRPDERLDPKVTALTLEGLKQTVDLDLEAAADTIREARDLLRGTTELARVKGLLRRVEQVLLSPRPINVIVREVGRTLADVIPLLIEERLEGAKEKAVRRAGVQLLRMARLLAKGADVAPVLLNEVVPALKLAIEKIEELLPDRDARAAIQITREIIALVRDPRIQHGEKIAIVVEGTQAAADALRDVEIE